MKHNADIELFTTPSPLPVFLHRPFAGGRHEGPARLIFKAVQHPFGLLRVAGRLTWLGRLRLGGLLPIVLGFIGPGLLLFLLLVHFIAELGTLLFLFTIRSVFPGAILFLILG